MSGLERFVEAQDRVYERVTDELRRGAKASHWMWFVFPQLRGLGRSETAWRYGISSLDEARAYWRHPVLGPRLKQCSELLLAVPVKTAREILGQPDDLKLRSSMTLFERAAPDEPVFARVLQRFFNGERDELTLSRI